MHGTPPMISWSIAIRSKAMRLCYGRRRP
jgi:hypothetical protein